MTHSVTLIIFGHLWRLLVVDKLKNVWKQSVLAESNYYPKICPQKINNSRKFSVRLLHNPTKIRKRILPHYGITSRVLAPGYKTQTNVCIG